MPYALLAVDHLSDSVGGLEPVDRHETRHFLTVAACLFLGAAACGFLWSWQNLRELELSHGGTESGISDKFASWQDWGGFEPVKTLHQALEMERKAWQMTRQETCSWEAGDPPPQFAGWKAWPEAGERCEPRESHLHPDKPERSDCWDILVSSCSNTSKCGASWQKAHKAALHKLGITAVKARYPLDDVSLCGGGSEGSRSWTSDEWERSQSWFERNVQVYVLEMPGLVISEQHETFSDLARHGLQAVRVAGLDLLFSDDLKVALAAGVVPDGFDPRNFADELGAASRAASHFHVQRMASALAGHKPLALVLEDGIRLARDFQQRVWSLIQEEIPCDWDVLSLSSSCPAGRCISPHLARIGPNAKLSRMERCKEMVSRGFGGILYRSAVVASIQKRWMGVAFDVNHPDCLSLDASLAALADEVAFYAVPAVQSHILRSC
ncbi:unnamed protein product [Durusdinium trenchii]|uniref:Uncharacterized protein n=1 Tax=Durusdinium trenchii TaxID=1381693 RepID=A0ABP0HAP0_9DINO